MHVPRPEPPRPAPRCLDPAGHEPMCICADSAALTRFATAPDPASRPDRPPPGDCQWAVEFADGFSRTVTAAFIHNGLAQATAPGAPMVMKNAAGQITAIVALRDLRMIRRQEEPDA